MDIKYKIILTDRAKYDLDDIYNYISKSLMAERAAENLMTRIQDSIMNLADMPEAFSIIEQYKQRDYQYRKLIVNNYLVIYRIDKEQEMVYIVRVIYGGRNYLTEL